MREPEGNGVAERTLKENLLWVGGLQTIEELRVALPEFAEAGRPSSLQETRPGQGRPAALHGPGRMNHAASCLISLVQYTRCA